MRSFSGDYSQMNVWFTLILAAAGLECKLTLNNRLCVSVHGNKTSAAVEHAAARTWMSRKKSLLGVVFLGSTSPPAEAQTDPMEDGDESCMMSMSEKLALFNKLALPKKLGAGPADGPPERRRQKGARYRTQPITVEEVNMVSVWKRSWLLCRWV